MQFLSRFSLLLAISSVLFAQTQMNVEQLVEMVRSELATKFHTDKQIGAAIRQIELTEKLTDKTIIDLEAQGAQGKTVEALKYLRDKTANMRPPSQDSTFSPATAKDQPVTTENPTATLAPKPAPIPPPSSVRQQEIIQAMRDYAINYTKSLPNFFCVEVTRQHMDPNGGESYRSIGTILSKVGYNEGREYYNVYSINGKLTETTMDNVKSGGATSSGEFGSLMRTIFDPRSQAELNWERWTTLRGRRMAVFSYFVDSGHSEWYITYGADKNDQQRIVTAYRGSVFADANTGEIDRIKFEAVDIPRSFPVQATSEILDYDLVAISGQQFIVPLKAKLLMKAGRESSMNEIEFRNYRKFESDSFIKYDLDPNAPPPIPSSATEEKPAAPTPSTASEPAKTDDSKTQEAPRKPNPWLLPTDVPPPPPR
jgi:hypothetical protein